MTYILPITTAILCILSFLLMLKDMNEHKELFKIEDVSENTKLLSKSVIVYSSIMVIVTVAISFLFCTLYVENGIFTSVKRLALLSLLWPIAYIDFKTYRIPNVFVIFGLVCRALILGCELVFDDKFMWMTVFSEFVAAAALLLAAGLCAICMKNSIGFGDIKLFIVMGLMLSLNGIWGAVFVSLVVSFFISAFLLISKKKTRKDAIPFGPAIVIGTYLSVCLSGM